jgi:phage shock protein C
MTKIFSPTGLYKDGMKGKIAGVCAGLGDYFGIRPNIVRLIAVLLSLFGFFVPVLIVYIALAFLLEQKPRELAENPEEDRFWREVRTRPDYMSVDLKRRFQEIEKRTRQLEALITSKQFRLNRELRQLDR